MLFEVKIPTESFATFFTCEWLFVVVRVHVKCQIVHLMESFAANVTLEGLLAGVRKAMVFIIAFLVKSFSTNVADKWLVAGMDANVSVQRRWSVESFSTNVTLVGFFLRVNDLVPAKSTGLPKTFSAYFALEGPSSRMYRHVASKIVMRIENFATNFAGECLRSTVTSFAANCRSTDTCSRKRRRLCIFQVKEATSGDKNAGAWVSVIASSRRRDQRTV